MKTPNYLIFSSLMLLLFNFSTIIQAQQKVTITTNAIESKVFISMSPIDWSFWDEDYKKSQRMSRQSLDTLNTVGFQFDAVTPGLYFFQPMGYNQYAYITPSDKVAVYLAVDSCIRGGKTLRFEGTNAVYYNYYTELNLYLCNYKMPWFSVIKDMNIYKKKVKEWQSVQNMFLENYQKNNDLRADFVETEKMRINSEYVNLICSPVYNRYITKDSLPDAYFDDVDKITFDNDKLLPVYFRAIFAKYIICSTNDVFSNIKPIYSRILLDKHLSKYNKEYLITALIGYFAYHQKAGLKKELPEIIAASEKQIENKDFLLNIKKSKEYFLYLNHPFPDNVLDQTMLVSFDSKDQITLRELMQKYSGQPMYFDFWASWCGACINDIQDSEEAKQLFKNKGVNYVYLSFDKDDNAWKKASEKNSIVTNQFRVIGEYSSALMQYLKFATIPQYVYLDKSHKLFSTAAPRPTPQFLLDLQTMIKASDKKVIQF